MKTSLRKMTTTIMKTPCMGWGTKAALWQAAMAREGRWRVRARAPAEAASSAPWWVR